jgi:hypothetical protein
MNVSRMCYNDKFYAAFQCLHITDCVKTYFSSFEVFAAVEAKALLLSNGHPWPEDDGMNGRNM